MKKKIFMNSVIGVLILTISILAASVLVKLPTMENAVTKVPSKLVRIDNVYEEIWNLVVAEKYGEDTVLTTEIEGACIVRDFGIFQSVYIPVNEEYSVSLSFDQYTEQNGEKTRYDLSISIHKKDTHYWENINYVYNPRSNMLYSNGEESLLMENFMSLYYAWVGADSPFSLDNPGEYTYQYAEYPSSYR